MTRARARAIVAVGPSAYKWTTGRARAAELNYIAFISSPCFYARGGRPANERSGAESIVSDRGCEGNFFFVGGRGGPQGPVCVRSVYIAAAAADVISEFDSLSALPDLRQISQSE